MRRLAISLSFAVIVSAIPIQGRPYADFSEDVAAGDAKVTPC
jgi:hypothetical protein